MNDRLPHSCGGCDNRWSGAGTCHCAACHRTFTGLSGFDKHRVGGECGVEKLFQDARGWWTPTEDAKVPSFHGRSNGAGHMSRTPERLEHLQ